MKRIILSTLLLASSPAFALDQAMFSETKFPEDRAAYIKEMKLEKAIASGDLSADKIGVDEIDINGDGIKEIFVHDYNSFSCGSHGCTTNVYAKKNGKLKPLMLAITDDTVGVGDKSSKHTGYRDIYLKGPDGKPIRWSYNGKQYVFNNK